MLTLLSPAKSLDFETPIADLEVSEPRFKKDTRILMKRAKELGADDLKVLMKISDSLAELNHERFQEMKLSFKPKGSKPCVLAFTGDVYMGLDAATLGKRDLNWAQKRVRILSGLYGLLRPLDVIQPYRLEMGTRLENARGGNLYEFWGERLAESINEEAKARKHSAVLNLASNEYFKAVPVKNLDLPLISAAFKEERGGDKPRIISFLAKRARGLMTRWIIDNRIDEPEGLKDFDAEGYSYREDLSWDDELVFVR